ncbi:DUF3106 domain-containing protein [Limnohabitans sp.]|uniref:DUF3106 domain-containing protein n=1 Tax=Limnohabitans sp. TaxID=1907725 RepID=UPI0038BB4CAB
MRSLVLQKTLISAQLLVLVGGFCVQHSAQAQQLTTLNSTQLVNSKPLWQDLTAVQQQALTPLAQLWPTMTEPHKRKWLAICQNFSQLSSEEKSVVQGRMREWAALSPQQRTLARLNFADVKQLPLEEKRSKWEAYQALSPEAKQKLATQQPLPAVGVAPAVKPVASHKLAATPVAGSSNKPLPRIDSQQAAPTTLLPPLPNTTAASGPPPPAVVPEIPVTSQ